MIKIQKHYLQNYDVRSNTTVISEVLCAYILDKYILPKNNLIVGGEPSKNLPDIYTQNKTLGYEVTICESDEDYRHKDITKELNKINYDYNKYLVLSRNPDSPLNDKKLRITTNGNKITSSMMTGFFHKYDWMKSEYKRAIKKKLSILKEGHYSGCNKVSLVILSIERILTISDAQILQQALIEENSNFENHFDRLYFFTTNDIFLIESKNIKKIHHYVNDEYSEMVNKMKKRLKIHQFKDK